jgi:hypothetical protein
MANFVTVGRRLIPREHIAFVEPFDPNANPKFQTSRDFKGRVVMVNRDSVLIEELPHMFAEANSFRMLQMDCVATNLLREWDHAERANAAESHPRRANRPAASIARK